MTTSLYSLSSCALPDYVSNPDDRIDRKIEFCGQTGILALFCIEFGTAGFHAAFAAFLMRNRLRICKKAKFAVSKAISYTPEKKALFFGISVKTIANSQAVQNISQISVNYRSALHQNAKKTRGSLNVTN